MPIKWQLFQSIGGAPICPRTKKLSMSESRCRQSWIQSLEKNLEVFQVQEERDTGSSNIWVTVKFGLQKAALIMLKVQLTNFTDKLAKLSKHIMSHQANMPKFHHPTCISLRSTVLGRGGFVSLGHLGPAPQHLLQHPPALPQPLHRRRHHPATKPRHSSGGSNIPNAQGIRDHQLFRWMRNKLLNCFCHVKNL